MLEHILSNVADVNNEAKWLIFLRAGQQHLNKNEGVGDEPTVPHSQQKPSQKAKITPTDLPNSLDQCFLKLL